MDRAILELAEKFGLKPQRIVKNKYYYIIYCNSQEYRLYACAISKEEILILASIKQNMVSNGLLTDEFMYYKDMPYFESEESIYVCMKMVKGKTLVLEDSADVLMTVENIGRLHKILENIPVTLNRENNNMSGLNKLNQIKNIINRKNKYTQADALFMNNFESMWSVCRDSIEIIDKHKNDNKNYIHSALKEENIVIDNNVAFINWNCFRVDFPLKDLAYFINRYVKKVGKNNCDCILFKDFIKAYFVQKPVDEWNLELLRALVLYPEKYIKVVSDYYKHPKPFTPVYIKNKIQECIEMSAFLREYVNN